MLYFCYYTDTSDGTQREMSTKTYFIVVGAIVTIALAGILIITIAALSCTVHAIAIRKKGQEAGVELKQQPGEGDGYNQSDNFSIKE